LPEATARRDATRQRRADILAAALRCFDDRGLVATTIEDIRGAAGVSVGSLYHHFPDKQAIAAALYVSLIEDYQSAAARRVERVRTPKARVRATIEHHIRWSLSHRAATRFLLSHREPEVRRLSDPDVAEMNRTLEARLHEWLDGQAAARRIRRMPADLYIALVIGPAQSYVRRWLLGSTATGPDEAIETLGEAAWRAVRAEPPTRRP
jgi:AcrR family transcriptional regulator